jgi:hypothetical protein
MVSREDMREPGRKRGDWGEVGGPEDKDAQEGEMVPGEWGQ